MKPEGKWCGGCTQFLFEDADGLGWCQFFDLNTRSDVKACSFYSSSAERFGRSEVREGAGKCWDPT